VLLTPFLLPVFNGCTPFSLNFQEWLWSFLLYPLIIVFLCSREKVLEEKSREAQTGRKKEKITPKKKALSRRELVQNLSRKWAVV
jgi:hypothetical protein